MGGHDTAYGRCDDHRERECSCEGFLRQASARSCTMRLPGFDWHDTVGYFPGMDVPTPSGGASTLAQGLRDTPTVNFAFTARNQRCYRSPVVWRHVQEHPGSTRRHPGGRGRAPVRRGAGRESWAGLILVRSVHAPSRGDSGAGQLRAIVEAEDYLAVIAAELTKRGFTVQMGVPYGFSPAEWIVEEVDLRSADLVVMAMHDRVRTDRLRHGSVAEDVVHRSPVPVMLVRAAEGLRPVEAFQRAQPSIIVPLDGSTLAESALAPAIELTRAIGGRMVLVGVVPAPGELVAGEGGAVITYVGDGLARLEDDAKTYLRSLGSRVAADSISISRVVRNGKPAVQIAGVARAQSAAAIVMATHARTGFARALLGSVAGEVIHQSPSPVMLVHPPRPSATRPSSSRESLEKLIGV